LSQTIQGKLVSAAKALLGFCLFWTALGEIYGGRGEQTYLRSTMLYQRARDELSTPLSHLLGRVRATLAGRQDELQFVKASTLIRRPIISMEEYLGKVDRNRLRRWNVVVIVVESLRADQLRAHGAERDVMRAVDALARESRVFTSTRSHSSQTSYAVLTPLSSHYPLRSTVQYTYPKDPSYPRVLIHDVLKKLGYRTAVFSSSNENWEGMIHYLQTGNIDTVFHASVFDGPTYLAPGDTFFGNWVMATRHAGSVDDKFTVDEAIQWIDRSPERPFFMYVNLQNSHVPYRVPEGVPRRFSPESADFTVRFGYFPKDKIDAVKDRYADSLAYVDAQIGRLLDHLRQSGLWEQTVVVMTGDQGQAFYEHGFAAHGSAIYDEVMKVPLVLRAPGIKPSIDDRPAQHIDVAPSVFYLLGLPAHPSFQGQNLMTPDADLNKPIFMVAQTPLAYQYGVVESHWKLIYDDRQRNYLLFNLADDPREVNNLAMQETSTLKRLADRLHTWRMAQIRYYSDSDWHRREYPPIVKD
jgi:arylsulfatase A-like enzyme